MPLKPLHNYREGYYLHVMASMALSLLLLIAAVRLWPFYLDSPDDVVYREFDQERISIEEISPTKQSSDFRPPPPRPPLTVVVPNDVILEQEELVFSDNLIPIPDPGTDKALGVGGTAGPPGNPNPAKDLIIIGPKPVRFVEPEYTREARRKRVRAEIVVDVVINEDGRVEKTEVVERFLFTENNGPKQPVDVIGYGLEEAATTAAEQWRFRPAHQGGKPVRSSTTLTFRFGV